MPSPSGSSAANVASHVGSQHASTSPAGAPAASRSSVQGQSAHSVVRSSVSSHRLGQLKRSEFRVAWHVGWQQAPASSLGSLLASRLRSHGNQKSM